MFTEVPMFEVPMLEVPMFEVPMFEVPMFEVPMVASVPPVPRVDAHVAMSLCDPYLECDPDME